MKINIIIVGANCSKCKKVHDRILQLVKEYHIPANVRYSDHTSILSEFNIVLIPAVIINDKVAFRGIVPSKNQLIELVNQYLPEQEQIMMNNSEPTEKYLFYLFLVALTGLIAWFVLQKDKKEVLCTEEVERIDDQGNIEISSIADRISMLYNYSQNNAYESTFLEFGARGCRACKMMEAVMDSVNTEFKGKINVVFYSVRTDSGKVFADYFNIKSIPVQVMLNKEGNEIFRHVGYFSSKELTHQILKNGIKN